MTTADTGLAGWRWAYRTVLGFWLGYLAITVVAGYLTALAVPSGVLRLTAWGLLSSLALVALTRYLLRLDPALDRAAGSSRWRQGLGRHTAGLLVGLLIGMAAFGLHGVVVSTFAGPIRLEPVAGVGAVAAGLYFLRFLATACMEELGFRGYTLRRLQLSLGVGPAVVLTSIAFGLSHLSYGWSLPTIVLGVMPAGVLWGMSAIATRGIAVPIGLHAAWNFAGWGVGSRKETGLYRLVLDEGTVAPMQAVGTASYLVVFGLLTAAFYGLHRRKLRREKPYPDAAG